MNPLSNLFTETVDAAPTSALTVDLTVIAWLVITSTVVGAFARHTTACMALAGTGTCGEPMLGVTAERANLLLINILS